MKNIKFLKTDLTLFIILIFYITARVIVGAPINLLNTVLTSFIDLIVLPIFFVSYYLKYLNKYSFVKYLLITGSVAASISTVAFFNGSFKLFLDSIQVQNELISEIFSYRSYGLAQGLTYSYAIVNAILFAITLQYLSKYKWSVIFIPMLILSVALNARTGIIVLAIGVFVWMINGKLFKTLTGVFILVLGSIVLFNIFDVQSINERSSNWILSFFNELSDLFLDTNKAGGMTTSTLKEMSTVLPDNLIDFLFGIGDSMFGVYGGTDIGYNRMINYGGFIYLFLFLLIVFNSMFKMYKMNVNKWYIFYFIVVILFSNIKGAFMPTSGGLNLIFLIYTYYILSKNNPLLKTVTSSKISI